MPFNEKERELLLATPYVGSKVIERLESIGMDSFKKLGSSSVEAITHIVAEMLGASCWKNSHQSKMAIQNAINTAKNNSGKKTSKAR